MRRQVEDVPALILDVLTVVALGLVLGIVSGGLLALYVLWVVESFL